MTFKAMWRDVQADLNRFQYRLRQPKIAIVLLHPGFQAVLMYRISHWLDIRGKLGRPLWLPVILLMLILERITEIITGIFIHPHSEIGPGLYIPHFGGIVIGEGAKIGKLCDLHQGVTLGYGGMGDKGGYPTVQDRVYMGAGAKIVGPVTVETDVIVGANAVVTQHIPARAIVGGSPAKVISLKGSFLYILYENMENDPERLASLQLVPSSHPGSPT